MKKINPVFLTSFIDVTMNLALFLAIIFVIVFLMVNPKADGKNKVEVKDSFLITMDWNNDANYDIDIHVKSPTGAFLWYNHKDEPWGTLERDDIGDTTDTYIIDQVEYKYRYNREVLHLRNLVDGIYTVNVHFYNSKDSNREKPQNIEIEMIQLEPSYKIVYKKKLPVQLNLKEEITAFSFEVKKGTSDLSLDTVTQEAFVNKNFEEFTKTHPPAVPSIQVPLPPSYQGITPR